ncbi:MAG TPA: hypothetical protein DDZ83_12135, partial [Nitrospinae bacterium]|nr:hypothetical protein [Nitrospinota bacterium]
LFALAGGLAGVTGFRRIRPDSGGSEYPLGLREAPIGMVPSPRRRVRRAIYSGWRKTPAPRCGK